MLDDFIHEYTNSYVAVLDILGFREFLKSHLCQDIYNILSSINFDLNSDIQMKSAVIFEDETMNIPVDEVQQCIISDTIIFSIDARKFNARLALVIQVAHFAWKLLVIEGNPILVRGAICKGDYYFDKDKRIMYGSAMINAYQLEEEVAIYPRIIIQQEIFDEVEGEFKLLGFSPDDYFYDDLDGFLCINYFSQIPLNEKEKIVEKLQREERNHDHNLKVQAKYCYITNYLQKMA